MDLRTLSQIRIFSNMPQKALETLARVVEEVRAERDQVIFQEGDPGDSLYLVVSGEIVIQKTIDRSKGTQKVIADLGSGDCFGEMALLDGAPRSASAVAKQEGILLRLPRQALDRFLSQDPATALTSGLALLATLSLRLRQTTRELVTLYEVGRTIGQILEAPALAQKILDQLLESLEGEEGGAFYLWNIFNEEFEIAARGGKLPSEMAHGFLQTHPLVLWLKESRQPLLSIHWETDKRFEADVRRGLGLVRSLLVAPLHSDKGLLGFVAVVDSEREGAFGPSHRQLVSAVAQLCVPAFEGAAVREEEASRRRLMRARTGPL